MNHMIYAPLSHCAVYEHDGEYLEAVFVGSTWWLYLLGDDGDHLEPQQGRLFAYELRVDGDWDSLYLVTIPYMWPSWAFLRGATITLDPAELKYVADSRIALQVAWHDQEERFRELMSPITWERE